MKIRSYKNSTVALIEKTSHGKSRIQAVELDPKNTSGGTEKWMVTGPQIIVPSCDMDMEYVRTEIEE